MPAGVPSMGRYGGRNAQAQPAPVGAGEPAACEGVQHDKGNCQADNSNQHEPVELKAAQANDEQILFVHIREPWEIEKFVKATEGVAKTLLVRGGSRSRNSAYGNAADDMVENYEYDYYFVNDRPLDETEENVKELFTDILK